jgi:hypothetical protein
MSDILIAVSLAPVVLSLSGDSAGSTAAASSSLFILFRALGAGRGRPFLRGFSRAVAALASIAVAAPLLFFLASHRARAAAADAASALAAGVGAAAVDAACAHAIAGGAERAAVAQALVFSLRRALLGLWTDSEDGGVFRSAGGDAGAACARALACAAVLVAALAPCAARCDGASARAPSAASSDRNRSARALALVGLAAAALGVSFPGWGPDGALGACAAWAWAAIRARAGTVGAWCGAVLALLTLPRARGAAGTAAVRKAYHGAFAASVCAPLVAAAAADGRVAADDAAFVCAALAGALVGVVLLEGFRALDCFPEAVRGVLNERLLRHADARDAARAVLLPQVFLIAGTLCPLLVEVVGGGGGGSGRAGGSGGGGGGGAADGVGRSGGPLLLRLIAAPIAVGVGDAAAALVGLWSESRGVAIRWGGGSTGKTVNGTVAFALSALAAGAGALAVAGALSQRALWVCAVSSVVGALAEAVSGDVDNIAVPVAAWATVVLCTRGTTAWGAM